MFSPISFRPVQAFASGNPDRQGKVFSRQFEANDEVILSKTPERELTEEEANDVIEHLNQFAEIFVTGPDKIDKELTEKIRELGKNPATTKAFMKLEQEEIKKKEERGLSPEDEQKTKEAARNTVAALKKDPQNLNLVTYLKAQGDNEISGVLNPYSINHLKREKLYFDTFQEEINKLKEDKNNPESQETYDAFQKVRAEEKKLCRGFERASKKWHKAETEANIKSGMELLFSTPEEE